MSNTDSIRVTVTNQPKPLELRILGDDYYGYRRVTINGVLGTMKFQPDPGSCTGGPSPTVYASTWSMLEGNREH